jgi:hypothetical protein
MVYVLHHLMPDPAVAEKVLRDGLTEPTLSVSRKASSPRLNRNMPKAASVPLDRPSAKRRAERKARITLAQVF